MTPYEQQAAEIKTIKPREFKLNLSDADVKRLFEKAYSNGITPEYLIESYLGDLLCGTYSNGSDERDLANEYFDRCDHNLGLTDSFLQWALEEDWYSDLAIAIEITDLAELYDDDDDDDELQAAKECITEHYNDYCNDKKQHGNIPQALDEGIAEIRRYSNQLNKALASGTSETDFQDDEDDQLER